MKAQLQLLILAIFVASQLVDDVASQAASCNCTGTNSTAGARYICGDVRLGPSVLPTVFPLDTVVTSYDRFGGLTPGEFLKKWINATRPERYVYPRENGFQLDSQNNPIRANMVIPNGTLIDRFGAEETGSYFSAADAPFTQRALPPSSLDNDPLSPGFPYGYHLYRVLKPLTVVGGPILPWFGQPGFGTQFYTGRRNVTYLIEQGYLERAALPTPTARGAEACG